MTGDPTSCQLCQCHDVEVDLEQQSQTLPAKSSRLAILYADCTNDLCAPGLFTGQLFQFLLQGLGPLPLRICLRGRLQLCPLQAHDARLVLGMLCLGMPEGQIEGWEGSSTSEMTPVAYFGAHHQLQTQAWAE